MNKLLLSLRYLLPRRQWIALLTFVARLRCSLRGWVGERYGWIWDRKSATFDRQACRRFLDNAFLPTFEAAAKGLPQPHGVDQCLTTLVIETAACQSLHRVTFDFPLEELDTAKRRLANALLSLTPMELQRGTRIRFAVVGVAELTLADFVCERMLTLRPIE